MHRSSMIAITALTLIALAAAGCQGTFDSEWTTVQMPTVLGGSSEEVWVESSLNRESKLGVRYLGAGAWGAAANKLNQAVDSGDNDARTHFALGVAYELDGNLNMAKAHYELALENAPEMDVKYEDAVRRIRAKLGEAPLSGG